MVSLQCILNINYLFNEIIVILHGIIYQIYDLLFIFAIYYLLTDRIEYCSVQFQRQTLLKLFVKSDVHKKDTSGGHYRI